MSRFFPLMAALWLVGCQAFGPQPALAPFHPAAVEAQVSPWSPPMALASAPSLSEKSDGKLATQPRNTPVKMPGHRMPVKDGGQP